jgi:RNA recognition motif-containing protein
MAKKLFVGSLAQKVTSADLEQLFAPYGTVQSAQVVMDWVACRSRGFGFVEMASEEEARAALRALNGKEVAGRSLVINDARPGQSFAPGGFQPAARRYFGGRSRRV